MGARRSAILCIYAIGAWVIAGAIGFHVLVKHLPYDPDPRYQFNLAYGLKLPVPVVADHPQGWIVLVAFLFFIVILGALGLWLSKRLQSRSEFDPRLLVWGLICVALIFSFFPVLFEGDVYAYVAYGRLYGLYGVNPYQLGELLNVRGDAILAQCLAFYGNPPPGDTYGPLWTLVAGGVSRAAASLSLFVQVWLFRMLGALSLVVTTLGIARILAATRTREGASRLALFAFHPLVLYEAVAAGHNDALMLAPLVWCFVLADTYPFIAGLLLGASIAIKYISLIAMPFLLIRIARREGWIAAVGTGLIAIAIMVVSFFPFWIGGATFRPLMDQLTAYRPSPAWLVAAVFYLWGKSGTLAVGHMPIVTMFALLLVFAAIVLIAVAVVRFTRTTQFAEIFRATTAALWASASVHPWYALWLTPALAGGREWRTYAWWLGLLIFLQYTQDILRHPESPAADHQLVLILVAVTVIVYTVPVIAARLSLRADDIAGAIKKPA